MSTVVPATVSSAVHATAVVTTALTIDNAISAGGQEAFKYAAKMIRR